MIIRWKNIYEKVKLIVAALGHHYFLLGYLHVLTLAVYHLRGGGRRGRTRDHPVQETGHPVLRII